MRSIHGISALALLLCACGSDRDDDAGGSTGITASGGDGAGEEDGGDSGGDRFDIGSPEYDAGAGEGGEEGCEEEVDIVFVMDVSTSMGGFLGKLAQEIVAVDSAIQQLNLPSPPRYGLVVFVDDTLFVNSGAAYTDVAQLQADFQQWSTFTQSNSQTDGSGWNDTWPENSLDALYFAATGFEWRTSEDTNRIIIHTTDDTFWDGPMVGNGVPIEHSYDEIVSALHDGEIRVFTFADTIGGQCECLDVTPGWFGPYNGSPALPETTDGEVWNINDVLAGTVSLSSAIPEAVEDAQCVPYPPQG